MPPFIDRHGSPWDLRPLAEADLPGWVALHQALATDGRGMILDVDEVATNVDDARQRCAPYLDHPFRHHALAAVGPDGTLGGTCELTRLDRRRIEHVAHLGMGVHPAHQGRGLGRALIEGALRWADAHGVHRVELFCRDDNPRGIQLYESVGFVHEGTRRAFALDPDGTYIDDRIYGRVL
jgi:RimJ/RimL family protein N-acetyltransferase